MNGTEYDLIVIGGGSGGLTAARFGAAIGARVALVEKNRIGGDCTWTGCVPSKALLKVARLASQFKNSSLYGIKSGPMVLEMDRVRDYVMSAVEAVYRGETPEQLKSEGIDVVTGSARFLDSHTVAVGQRTLCANAVVIATGAQPTIPELSGLADVPFKTYENIFENDRLPERMIVIGAGPVGVELAQAYQRLGSRVTIVADQFLPREDSDVSELMLNLFAREGIQFIRNRATYVRKCPGGVLVGTAQAEATGDLLLVASGRKPCVEGLDLEKAGVRYSELGIAVDSKLRTNVRHIYAAGDVIGGYQFTHLAGWQAFRAARNGLLPGGSTASGDPVPRVTFTDPEIAHVGLTESEARKTHGGIIAVHRLENRCADRAICDGETNGFIKVTTKGDRLLGATVVSARAGEVITEFTLAIKHQFTIRKLAGAIHPYPTYSTPVQQMTAELALRTTLMGFSGMVLRCLARLRSRLH